MEERSLVSALKLAKFSVAPSEGETSESRFRREQAAKLADCILQTYKQYREESDKLIKDPDFLQEVKQVCFKLLDGLFVGYRAGRVASDGLSSQVLFKLCAWFKTYQTEPVWDFWFPKSTIGYYNTKQWEMTWRILIHERDEPEQLQWISDALEQFSIEYPK